MRVVMRLRKKSLNNPDATLQMGGKQLFCSASVSYWEKSVMGIAQGKNAQYTWQCALMFSSGTGTEPVHALNSGRGRISVFVIFVLLHQGDVISTLVILTFFKSGGSELFLTSIDICRCLTV